ncbi:MAG: rhodanese-like domain-containing protein [Bacilli bacterium]
MGNAIVSVLLVLILVYLVYRMLPAKGVASIKGSQLQEKLAAKKTNGAQFIDVREPAEYKGGHVPGFRNVPLGQIANRLGELPKDAEVVLMCRSGSRSMMAAKILKKNGYQKIVNVSGGISQWTGTQVK